ADLPQIPLQPQPHDVNRQGHPHSGAATLKKLNEELPAWKEKHNASHRKVRARVEHSFARMKSWKILRDCRLKDEGVHHATLGIARLYNLTLTG
ncbi:transposase, partial [Streptomyces flaveolus]|uniref:transposase n=1 Tax=Streptomyces flaveolus TaxID=67297 RepID=UPI003438D04A